MNDLKVSIIVPVYNTEKYLRQCIDSILAQTYTDLEIILVDDGSLDSSGAICDEYAAKDSRVRVFHIENGGVSNARNYALDRATGEYVMFVDADDLVKPEYVDRMTNAAINMSAELAVCRFMHGGRYTLNDFYAIRNAEKVNIKKINLSDYRWTGNYAHHEVWCSIFDADLIRDLRFSTQLYIGEDTVFFAQVLKKAGSILFVDEQLYYYRYNESSLMNRKFQDKNLTEIKARECISDMFADQSDAFRNECEAILAMRCKLSYCKAVHSHYPDNKRINEIYKKAWKRRKNVYRSTGYGKKTKLDFAFFVYMPKMYILYEDCNCLKKKGY